MACEINGQAGRAVKVNSYSVRELALRSNDTVACAVGEQGDGIPVLCSSESSLKSFILLAVDLGNIFSRIYCNSVGVGGHCCLIRICGGHIAVSNKTEPIAIIGVAFIFIGGCCKNTSGNESRRSTGSISVDITCELTT